MDSGTARAAVRDTVLKRKKNPKTQKKKKRRKKLMTVTLRGNQVKGTLFSFKIMQECFPPKC